jgi:hypothetical protein
LAIGAVVAASFATVAGVVGAGLAALALLFQSGGAGAAAVAASTKDVLTTNKGDYKGDTGPQGGGGGRGDQGERGHTGDRGTPGRDGDDGEDGAAGPTGAYGQSTFTWAKATHFLDNYDGREFTSNPTFVSGSVVRLEPWRGDAARSLEVFSLSQGFVFQAALPDMSGAQDTLYMSVGTDDFGVECQRPFTSTSNGLYIFYTDTAGVRQRVDVPRSYTPGSIFQLVVTPSLITWFLGGTQIAQIAAADCWRATQSLYIAFFTSEPGNFAPVEATSVGIYFAGAGVTGPAGGCEFCVSAPVAARPFTVPVAPGRKASRRPERRADLRLGRNWPRPAGPGR